MLRVGLIAISYLIGSIPTGLLIVRAARGLDIRQYGSGNIGTVNVMRIAGASPAVVVLVADALKGAVPVLLGGALGAGTAWPVAAGLVAIAGHNWSVWLRFRGGKGVATTLGATLALDPAAAAAGVVVWVVMVGLTRYSSVGSMAGALSVPVFAALAGRPQEYVVFGALAAASILFTHRSNISRLAAGKELKIAQKVGPPAGDP